MCPTLPGDSQESVGNGALNKPPTPTWPLVEKGQFILGSADERCLEAASRACVLVKDSQARNGFTLSTVATLVGKEAPYVSKCLDREEPHAVLRMVAALLLLDRDHTFLAGLATMAGCDLVERETLSDAEFRRRVEAWAKQAKSHQASLTEALGSEDAP